jgi:hypothetical protein
MAVQGKLVKFNEKSFDKNVSKHAYLTLAMNKVSVAS